MAAAPDFTADERNLLIRLPRWAVGAANTVHSEGPARTRQKIENGFLAVGNGRTDANALVKTLSSAAISVYDDDPSTAGIDLSTQAGIDLVVGYAQTAMVILRTKATAEDASAYRKWLLGIIDFVITDVRHERIGFGGVHVHPDAKQFRDRLADATRATPPAA